MFDTYGDGWDGAYWTWTAEDGTAETGTLEDSSGTADLCGNACYTFEVSSGSYPYEISWSIESSADVVEAEGGADDTVSVCTGTASPSVSLAPTPVPSPYPIPWDGGSPVPTPVNHTVPAPVNARSLRHR